MKKSDIKVLHAQLMEYMEVYYSEKGFKYDKAKSSFELNNVKIFLIVETESGSYYTIRPGFTVVYKDILDKIKTIISA